MRSLVLLLAAGCNPPLPGLGDAHRDYADALPVFPGAEGFGTDTPAGRGGEIYVVDSLAADGPGSLAEALAAPGARTVVFSVGGVIVLDDNITVTEPYLTVAGQTAPWPGITVYGAGLVISTHDVLIQHLAVRPGGSPDGPDPELRDAVAVIGDRRGDLEVYNVVVDHVSLSWSVDETFSTWYPGVRDVTLSNSILAEALDDSLHPEGPHSKALLFGDHTRRIASLRNILAYNDDRNPIIKGDASALVVNQWVVDPGRWPVTLFDQEGAGPSLLSIQSSVFERGADTPPEHATVLVSRSVKADSALHLSEIDSWDGGAIEWESSRDEDIIASTPPISVSPLTVLPTEGLPAILLRASGARPADRDPVDQRIAGLLAAGEGTIINNEAAVGGLELLETHHALSLPEAPDADPDGNGYTALEEWLHAAAADVEGRGR